MHKKKVNEDSMKVSHFAQFHGEFEVFSISERLRMLDVIVMSLTTDYYSVFTRRARVAQK